MSVIPTAQGLYRLEWKRRDEDIWTADDWALIYAGTWRWCAVGERAQLTPDAFEAKLAAYWMWEIVELTWDGAIAYLENKKREVKYRHAARSNALILDVESAGDDRLSVDQKIAIAQVRAQMATIEKIGLQTEQLRIGNLIEFLAGRYEGTFDLERPSSAWPPGPLTDDAVERNKARNEIRQGLGL